MAQKAGNDFWSLADGELIDDRSLEAFDRDSFGHADFVRELAGVVYRTRTPANIALFGPWGSGKSGIANLLEQELPKEQRSVRFVTFDASKYAEAPLRRHFVSQVAHGLDIKADKYHKGLYTAEQSRDVRFRPGEWARLAFWFLASVALTLGVLLIIATLVAVVSTGPFATAWSNVVKDYLLATLPVAAVITTFVKLAADGFHISTTRSAPSGDEEFERHFRDLVEEAKTERLVVFIDELDRCSPAQVASTLETMKTFLFVDGCVFIVAADQQVLEQALRREVRQHTPEDAANPYYSAGSSYLDKVFQYQLTLPPLKAPTLSRFALHLVDGRPGVWERVDGVDELVSVLIPTHVVSPRRVKVLLNRFAIAYRLAERRAVEGRLDPDFGRRATELAKLVCLQCEFPLFAEDLTLDARLPELVRMSADGDELPSSVRGEVGRRARAFANGERVVAELLVKSDVSTDQPSVDGRAPDGDVSADGAGAAIGDEAVATRLSRGDAVAKQHAQQLVSYLRKTRHILGPAPDLLYLESAGADYGVDAIRADRLERAAIDNDTGEVLTLVASAADDQQGRGALLVLADVVRQAQPGVEGRNVVSALMQGIERSGVDLDGAADPIADAVAGHLAQASFEPDDLPGALVLAGSCERDVGPQLVKAVITHPAAAGRADVATALLGHAAELPEELAPLLAGAARTALLRNAEAAAQQLASLPRDDGRRVLGASSELLKPASKAHYDAVEAQAQDGGEADEGALLDRSPHESLAGAFDTLAEAGSPLRVEMATLMLDLHRDRPEYRHAMADRLHRLAPITDQSLVGAVLGAAHRRQLSDWPRWLDPLDPQATARTENVQEWVDSLSANLWGKAAADDPPAPADLDIALAALGRCAQNVTLQIDLHREVAEALEAPFTTDVLVEAQADALARAEKFVGAGLLDCRALADMDLSACALTLEASMADVPAGSREEADAALVTRVRKSALLASSEKVKRILEAVPEVSSWLSDADQASMSMNAATALSAQGVERESPLELDELRALADESGVDESADEAISLWLATFAGTPEDAWRVVEPLVGRPLSARTYAALSDFAQELDGNARFELVDKAVERATTDPVDASFLQAAHISEVSPQRFAKRLIEVFGEAEDASSQRAVMVLWQQFSPSGQGVPKRLVEDIYLPLIGSGDEGLDLAISFFGLVASVDGVRKKVRQALRDAARTKKQQSRVDKRLVEAGWAKKSLFGLSRPRDRG